MPSTEDGSEVRMKRALNCWPWVRSLTHSPDAVIPFARRNHGGMAHHRDQVPVPARLILARRLHRWNLVWATCSR